MSLEGAVYSSVFVHRGLPEADVTVVKANRTGRAFARMVARVRESSFAPHLPETAPVTVPVTITYLTLLQPVTI